MYKYYLKQLPPGFAGVVFRAKTRKLDIKTNYKNKYSENLKCPFCCVLDESFDHIFTCRFGITIPKKLYTSGYSPLVQKFHCQFLKDWAVFLQNTVHILSKWLVDYNGKWCYFAIYSDAFLCIRFQSVSLICKSAVF